MVKGEFWLYFNQNPIFGISIIFIVNIFCFLFYRKYIYSVLDPLVLFILMSASGYSVVFILKHFDIISNRIYLNFLLTQCSFMIGFKFFKPINLKKKQVKKIVISRLCKILFVMSIFLYIVSQLIVYTKVGIPLLMESRLEAFTGGYGFGIFSRILYVTEPILISIATVSIFQKKERKNFFYKITLLIILTNSVLSGSKYEGIEMVFTVFFVFLFLKRSWNPKGTKKVLKINFKIFCILLFIIFSVIIIIQIQLNTNFGKGNSISPFMVLAMRFVNTGDIYMMSYPYENYLIAEKANGIIALFSPILGTLRLIEWEKLPNAIGLQLFQKMHETQLIAGPNTRHNIFGLFYFGFYGSIIFSYFAGLCASFLRNKLYYLVRNNMIGMLIFILMAKDSLNFETDPVSLVSNFLSIILIFPFLYFISLIIDYSLERIEK